jgi:hypothetical protein
VRVDHVVPFVVRKTVPASPTATPAFPLVKKASRSCSVVPLACLDQDAPPSVVFKIVPASPTTTPVFRSVKNAPRSVLPWGTGFCQYQPDGAAGGGMNGLSSSDEQP